MVRLAGNGGRRDMDRQCLAAARGWDLPHSAKEDHMSRGVLNCTLGLVAIPKSEAPPQLKPRRDFHATGLPQVGQTSPMLAPHAKQNRASLRFSDWHAGHRIFDVLGSNPLHARPLDHQKLATGDQGSDASLPFFSGEPEAWTTRHREAAARYSPVRPQHP
jgi:hypothetical protein